MKLSLGDSGNPADRPVPSDASLDGAYVRLRYFLECSEMRLIYRRLDVSRTGTPSLSRPRRGDQNITSDTN